MKKVSFFMIAIALFGLNEAMGQWGTNGTHIYNSNSGFVGIGTNSPGYLLHVSKSMVSPSIRIQNAGGSGGAAFEMIDNFSGADWKFKATNAGGFKIRDHAHGMDVIVAEPNSAANMIYLKSGGNLGIGTNAPESSAMLDVNSTSKGFLPPRMTEAQLEAISNPANGLLVFCTTNDKYYTYIENTGEWKEILFGSEVIAPPFSCGNNITRYHVVGSVAPVTKTVTYGTVTNIPGEISKCWITSNLGAGHQAASQGDDTEASAGWYWQFNRMQGFKHDGATRTPNTTWIDSIDEDSDWLPGNDPCTIELGGGWRLPTSSEWTNVDASGNWITWDGPWDSALKLHAAGWLDPGTGVLVARGVGGDYWSSSQFNNTLGNGLSFYITHSWVDEFSKSYGFTARCLQN